MRGWLPAAFIPVAAVGAVPLLAAVTSTAYARATFVIENADPPGMGLNDATPVEPVGGNQGTTLGEQRLLAVRYAADIWAQLLESAEPVVVQVSFGPLPCSEGGTAELGHANAYGAATNVDGPGTNIDWYYSAPLANRLLGRDVFTNEPDIVMEFNGDVDGPDCLPGIQWYYGLDGDCGRNADLVTNVLHELAHGLGVAHFVDMISGELPEGRGDPFAANIFDSAMGKGWLEMTDAERRISASNVRQVVWGGPAVTEEAPAVLAYGAPRLSLDPEPAGFSGLVSEANLGPTLSENAVEAELVLGSPRYGCSALGNGAGRVVLLYAERCHFGQMVVNAQEAGAVGVLIAYEQAWQSPPASLDASEQMIMDLQLGNVTIPALSITFSDARTIESALDTGTVTARMGADSEVLVGADVRARVFLAATDPVLESSTLSHWDTLARPNLLMEPSSRYDEFHHDVDLTLALLRDLGWFPQCGNGQLDQGEQCDDGLSNSDIEPDACRMKCLRAGCGDGVVDSGEQCDEGVYNSDTEPDTCRTSCLRPTCGDGVVDRREQCDQGSDNLDPEADARAGPNDCRSDCTLGTAADGEVDGGSADGASGGSADGAAGGAAQPDAAAGEDAAPRSQDSGGCGCRTVRPGPGPTNDAMPIIGLLILLMLRRPRD